MFFSCLVSIGFGIMSGWYVRVCGDWECLCLISFEVVVFVYGFVLFFY